MNLPRLLLVLAAAAPALACDARGISVGTEELCVADPALLLAAADSTEHISTCARIGENQMPNGGFESPAPACQNIGFCQLPAADLEGWQTTSATNVIEVWLDGYTGVPAPEGSQFVELNAASQDTLWQELALTPGQLMYWSVLHRGRDGVEIAELRIGPPDALVSQGVFRDEKDTWYPYSGLYRVGETESVTRFELISHTGTSSGNLIDAVVFAPVD